MPNGIYIFGNSTLFWKFLTLQNLFSSALTAVVIVTEWLVHENIKKSIVTACHWLHQGKWTVNLSYQTNICSAMCWNESESDLWPTIIPSSNTLLPVNNCCIVMTSLLVIVMVFVVNWLIVITYCNHLSHMCVLQYQYTPLHYAALNGTLDSVKVLLDKGAAVDAKDTVSYVYYWYVFKSTVSHYVWPMIVVFYIVVIVLIW